MSEGDRVRAHVFVSGKVQGVFFRANTREQAQER
ncbi:MAG: acylphosphatase, partial [Halodesulfurarchaeum sp.]